MGNEEILKEKSEKYFKDISSLQRLNVVHNQEGNANDLSENINLRISISNTEENYNYQVFIFNVDKSGMNPLDKSENKNSNTSGHITFDTMFLIKYFFEKEQKLSFKISKHSNSYGTNTEYMLNCSLGQIMGSRKNTLELQLPNTNEKLIASCEKLNGDTEKYLNLQINITTNKQVDFQELKNKIIFFLEANNNKIYKSECIDNKGKFKSVKIPCSILFNKKLTLYFIDCKNRKVGYFPIQSLDKLTQKGQQYTLEMSSNRTFYVTPDAYVTKNYSFVDFLKAGVQIGLSIAIDYTASNGNVGDPKSLHFLNGPEPNQYEQAIYACGNIVAYYDYDQLFPVYGFGGKVNGALSHCFNINMTNNPNIHLIENIIGAYHNSLSYVHLYGPTYFAPIISATNEMIKAENDNTKYHILMIITDGQIDDIDRTIDALVESSKLPLSVIIIGVGSANFDSMVVLDADENPLRNYNGEAAVRDLVQFVPFNKYKSNAEGLAREVLAEIPGQIVGYYSMNRIIPEDIMEKVWKKGNEMNTNNGYNNVGINNFGNNNIGNNVINNNPYNNNNQNNVNNCGYQGGGGYNSHRVHQGDNNQNYNDMNFNNLSHRNNNTNMNLGNMSNIQFNDNQDNNTGLQVDYPEM